MLNLFQTLDWLDLVALVLPLVTLVLAPITLVIVVPLGGKRTWSLLLSASAACCIAFFGLLICSYYFPARLAGAPASFQLILNCVDTSGAMIVLTFIATVASLPFLRIFLIYLGKIRYNPSQSEKVWLCLIQKLIAGALFILSMAVGFLVFRSQMVSTILFGDPKALERLEQLGTASQSLATNTGLPGRFSVILDRLSSALGFNRTTGFDVVATTVTISAILQGIAALLSLYDRLRDKESRKSDSPSEELPLPRPMSIDSYHQLIHEGEQLFDNQGAELPHNTPQV